MKIKTHNVLTNNVLETLWRDYRKGSDVYIVAHPSPEQPMSEMQAYVARSFILKFYDTLDKSFVEKAEKVLCGTLKYMMNSKNPLINKAISTHTDTCNDFHPNNMAMIVEDFIRLFNITNKKNYLINAVEIAEPISYYYDKKTGKVAGGYDISKRILKFNEIIAANESSTALIMLYKETGRKKYLELAKKFISPRIAKDDPLRIETDKGIFWYQKENSKKIHWHHIAYIARALQFMYKHTGNKTYYYTFLKIVEWFIQTRHSSGFWKRSETERNYFIPIWYNIRNYFNIDIATTAQVVNIMKDAYTFTGNEKYLEIAEKSLESICKRKRNINGRFIPVERNLPFFHTGDRYVDCWDLNFFIWANKEMVSKNPYVLVPKDKNEWRSKYWMVDGDCVEYRFDRSENNISIDIKNLNAIERKFSILMEIERNQKFLITNNVDFEIRDRILEIYTRVRPNKKKTIDVVIR